MTTTLRSMRRSMRSHYPVRKFVERDGIKWREDGWPFMQSILPPGEKGDASISHFTVSEKDADSFNLSLRFTAGTGGQDIEPGGYVRLHIGKRTASDLMMSDTPFERRTNWDVRREGRGQGLIAGLGIGMIIHPLLDRMRTREKDGGKFSGAPKLPFVDHVTVVELNQNVIDLVGPTLERYGDRVSIVHANIHDFDPGKKKFDVVYFDIWKSVSEDNLPEIATLHQRWKTRLNRTGETKPWMSSWEVEVLRAQRKQDSGRWW